MIIKVIDKRTGEMNAVRLHEDVKTNELNAFCLAIKTENNTVIVYKKTYTAWNPWEIDKIYD